LRANSTAEIFSLVFLTFIIEETKILLYFLILALNFAVTFKVIGPSEAGFDAKMLVESTHKMGRKLGTVIREDFLRDSVKAEDIPIVKIGSILSH
jgi:hypothetical protein